MKEFIIGTEGSQKFPIKGSRVSRQHAKITIDDNGAWILEDLNSTNGTFIMDENCELVQIQRVYIDEFTRIVFADQTAMGFSFIAHHVIEEDPNNYQAEFRHVLRIHDKAMAEKREMDKKLKSKAMYRFIPSVISGLIGLVMTCILPPAQKVYAISATALFTALLTLFINYSLGNDDSQKKFSAKYAKKLVCPHCGRSLNEAEFNNQQCAACKAHA